MGFDMHVQGASDYEANTRLQRGFDDVVQLCGTMIQVGMAFASSVPEFPESDHLDRSDFHDDHAISERAKLYLREREQTLVDHGGGDYVPGIPAHKLFSKDGWHVTSKECLDALIAYNVAMEAGVEHPEMFEEDVIPFLRTAIRYEGFRVC